MLFIGGIYLFLDNNRNTKTIYEICSKLTIKHQNDVNYDVLVRLISTLNKFHTLCSGALIVEFEQVNASWVVCWMSELLDVFLILPERSAQSPC